MISSAKLKSYRSLSQKKFRRKEGKFLIEGLNLCQAALVNHSNFEIILISEKVAEDHAAAAIMKSSLDHSVPFEVVPEKIVEDLSDTVSPSGIVAVVNMKIHDKADFLRTSAAEVIILDRIRDPGNLGTILRTAEWFGIRAIGLTHTCVDVHNSKVLRSSSGSYFSLEIIQPELELIETLEELKKRGYGIIVATSSPSQAHTEVDFRRPFVLVLGGERHGVDPGIAAISFQDAHVPKRGNGDSLNVAVSAGIILSEAFRENR